MGSKENLEEYRRELKEYYSAKDSLKEARKKRNKRAKLARRKNR